MERPPLSTHPVAELLARSDNEKSRIVVPLSSKPRDYVPGSGPPLQRLCLLPPNDSTAYIVDRILLPSPGLAADRKPLPKRMTYIIGWRDLPAARLLVPAMKVLDYLSPQALEEWEWSMEMELDDERQKLAEDRHKVEPVKVSKKKQARPPAHTAIESAIVADPETEAQTHPKIGVMSLSTPQQSRLEDFDEGLSDDEDDEESPSRQLARETGMAITQPLPDGTEVGIGKDSLKPNFTDTQEVNLASLEQTPLGFGWGSDVGRFDEAVALTPGASLLKFTPGGPSALPFSFDSATQTPSGTSSRFSSIPRQSPRRRLPVLAEGNGGFVSLNANGARPTTPNTTTRPPTSERPPSSDKAPSALKQAKQATPSSRPPAKKAKPKTKPVVRDDDGEPIWEVKRIEDMEVYEVEGRGIVRYFRVLWEGDWPPDQNPTWEPEDNIQANMVRNYFKRGSEKKRKRPSRASISTSAQKAPKLKQPPLEKPKLSVGKQYSSVSEAFTGDIAHHDALGRDDIHGNDHAEERGGDNEDDNELLVVDEGQIYPVKSAWTAANGH